MNSREAAEQLLWAYLTAELTLCLKPFTIEGYNEYIVKAQKAGEWYATIDKALQIALTVNTPEVFKPTE